MRRNKAERSAFNYRMKVLTNKLEVAESLNSKATLDEWETTIVAKMLKNRRKGWAWVK